MIAHRENRLNSHWPNEVEEDPAACSPTTGSRVQDEVASWLKTVEGTVRSRPGVVLATVFAAGIMLGFLVKRR